MKVENEPVRQKGVFRRPWWAAWFRRPRRQAGYTLERLLESGLVLDPETGCLLWRQGERRVYGALSISAHRLAWEMANGCIPAGMQVLHRCDEPRCCNPEHLFLGTQSENMADMRRKGRGRNQYTGVPKAPQPRPGLANSRRKRVEPGAQPTGGRT